MTAGGARGPMNTTRPSIILAGLPQLAAEVQQAGVFNKVLTADSVRQLLSTFSQAGQDVKPGNVVLVFADTLTEDVPDMPVNEIIRRLTTSGFHVIIVSVTARGADMSRQHPQAGLLPMPVRLNDLLYAVSTFGFAIEPVQPAASQPQTIVATQPETSGTSIPSTGGWGRPAGNDPEPPVPAFGTQPAQPAQKQVAPRQPVPAQPTPRTAPVVQAPASFEPVRQEPPQQHQVPAAFGSTPATGNLPPLFTQSPTQSPASNPWGQQSAPVGRVDGYRAVPTPESRRGFVITVAVSKGGTGKSSLSLNLGAFLGMRLRMLNKTVCVVDANFQQADAGKYLGGQYRPNINTIADNPALLTRERILEGLVHRVEYNLSVLLGPATPDDGNPININAQLYNEILELLKAHYDYIIIDTPVAEKHHEIFANFALPKADYIVVPVAPSFPTLHNADNWLRAAVTQPRHVGGAGKSPAQIGIVLNRAEDGIGCSEDDVRMTMANWQFVGSIPETKEWKLANNNNELVAPKNFIELNQAFANILYYATGEQVLMANFAEPEKKSFLKRILSRKDSR